MDAEGGAPLISVIITCFNYGDFLPQCIESVLSQSYCNLEVLVVDDGSVDSTPAVCAQYEGRVRVVRHENRGVVFCRNEGAQLAHGGFFLFLDADNWLAPDALLSLQARLAESPEAAFSFGSMELFGELEGKSETMDLNWLGRSCLHLWNFIDATALIRASAFSEIGGFDMGLNRGAAVEDWELWLRMLKLGHTGLRVNKITHHYRIHGSSRSALFDGSRVRLKAVERTVRAHYLASIPVSHRIAGTLYLALGTILRLRVYNPYIALTTKSKMRYLLHRVRLLVGSRPRRTSSSDGNTFPG
jgi:glycosyltransferase involved in cell wall biosynthesis